jgi:quinol monooxygenase YgiN
MVIELMNISVSQKKRQELGKALASLIGPIQVEPGCVSCHLMQSLPAQDELQIEARWESQEYLIRHLQSDIYKRLLLLMELSAAPPVLEFLTVVELRGLELVESARTRSV